MGFLTRKPMITRNTEDFSKPVYAAEWLKLPTCEDVLAVYPNRAKTEALKDPVMVNMSCGIRPDGHLEACEITEESLRGYAFGEAALKLSTKFEIKTTAPDGSALPGLKVGVPMNFDPIFAPDETGQVKLCGA